MGSSVCMSPLDPSVHHAFELWLFDLCVLGARAAYISRVRDLPPSLLVTIWKIVILYTEVISNLSLFIESKKDRIIIRLALERRKIWTWKSNMKVKLEVWGWRWWISSESLRNHFQISSKLLCIGLIGSFLVSGFARGGYPMTVLVAMKRLNISLCWLFCWLVGRSVCWSVHRFVGRCFSQ